MHTAALRYIAEVARRGSVRKAAAALNVAASAIDRQLLKIEASLGTPLFDRTPGGMRPTPAGAILLRHVADTLLDFERVRAEIDDLRGIKTGNVAIAAVDSLLVEFLPRMLDRLRADFPAVSFSVNAAEPAGIAGLVAGGEIDLGFTFVGPPPPGTAWLAAVPAPLGVVMPAAHPLARRRSLRLEDLRGHPVVLPTGPLPRTMDVDPGFAAFREVARARLVSNSIALLKHAIRAGAGISFFTRIGFMSEIAAGEIAWRPLAARPVNRLKLGLLAATSRPRGFAALRAADLLAGELKALAG
ncbi:MAG: LysR family transcriptional regulator [Rhodospirillales bacterium]